MIQGAHRLPKLQVLRAELRAERRRGTATEAALRSTLADLEAEMRDLEAEMALREERGTMLVGVVGERLATIRSL